MVLLPGEEEFAGPPVLPNALLQLELCLSEPSVDLSEVTAIVRGDVGMTAQLLRLAAREIEESPAKVVSISDIVVDVGVEKLRALMAHTEALPEHRGSLPALRLCERFWRHSKLTALIAEELARRSCAVRAEDAYLAGLLCRLGDLRSLLDWARRSSEAATSSLVGYQMARAWRFPQVLVDVIGGDREACRTRESRVLLDIVTSAGIWASRLEFLAARESLAVRTRNPPYRPGRN